MVASNGNNHGISTQSESNNYDRMKELKAFDETKAGVRGLVDAGIKEVPRIFISPPTVDDDIKKNLDSNTESAKEFSIPVIDLGDIKKRDAHQRKLIIDQVINSCENFGFFQVVNHGVPKNLTDGMLEKVRLFHEQPAEVRAAYYSRNLKVNCGYVSNFDLYQAPSANWRDTYYCSMAPTPPKPEEIPTILRDTLMEYSGHVEKLGLELFELISEGLGLKPNHLMDIDCAKGWALLCHYYPECPQPELTIGTAKHADSSFLTILLQDNHISGLQVLHQNQWVDVPPVPGALIVNIGDLLQLLSNDRLKSVEHRVLANLENPRVSVACFFHGTRLEQSSRKYGPIKELLSESDRPKYRETTIHEYITHFQAKGLDGKSALDVFKI
ncbi:1-aminocyclopropane-1-carboxylate oxidase homolog 1-like [Papaver somniferum]|uniref:1-aminocyclopropane-1-carboxylate oxidase homolog 1-like n=1 Tax=Papaver somniferum TaxID=3469 RepID=UPI000E7001F2|nr:1-aminocyclopropane-1-carboxylate oxidase homolog 1-like [Papaver somniferum]